MRELPSIGLIAIAGHVVFIYVRGIHANSSDNKMMINPAIIKPYCSITTRVGAHAFIELYYQKE